MVQFIKTTKLQSSWQYTKHKNFQNLWLKTTCKTKLLQTIKEDLNKWRKILLF